MFGRPLAGFAESAGDISSAARINWRGRRGLRRLEGFGSVCRERGFLVEELLNLRGLVSVWRDLWGHW